MTTQVAHLETLLTLNTEEFEKSKRKAEASVRQLSRAKIAPVVNTAELHALNRLYDKKIAHHTEVVNHVKRNPIAPNYDGRSIRVGMNELRAFNAELNRVKSDLGIGGRLDATVTHRVTVDMNRYSVGLNYELRRLGSDISKDIGRVVDAIAGLKPSLISRAVGLVGRVATAPVRIAANVAGQAAGNVFTGFTEDIGRTLFRDMGQSSTLNLSRQLKKFSTIIDQEIIGRDKAYATFFAEFFRSGDLSKAFSRAIPRSEAGKIYERLMKLQEIVTQPSLKKSIAKINEDDELKTIFKNSGGDLRTFLENAQPKNLSNNIINPMVEEFQPMLRFIQDIRAARTAMESQKIYNERKAAFPILDQFQTIVNVAGGAQFKGGQGGRNVAMGLEMLAPQAYFMPVENPDTDAALAGKEPAFEKWFKEVIFASIPGINGEFVNTAVNGLRQVSTALNPFGFSQSAAQGIANTRLAGEQGKGGSFVSFSLGGMDSIAYGNAQSYLGLGSSSLAMNYPFMNLAGRKPDGFNAGVGVEDPLSFPMMLGLGFNPGGVYQQSGGKAIGANAHHYKHILKNTEFLELFFRTIGTEMPDISGRDIGAIIEAGEKLYEIIGAAEQMKSLSETGSFNPNSPFHAFMIKGGESEVNAEQLLSKFFEWNKAIAGMTKADSPEVRATGEALKQYFINIQEAVVRKLREVQFPFPANIDEMVGYQKYQSDVGQLNWWSGEMFAGINPKGSMQALSGQVDEIENLSIPWFKKPEQKSMFGEEYVNKIVAAYKNYIQIAKEFIRTNGQLSESFKQGIVFPQVNSYGQTTQDFLMGNRLDTFSLPKEEVARVSQLGVPKPFEQKQSAILAYNQLQKAIPDILPPIDQIRGIGAGMSGAITLLGNDLTYKTDLDPDGLGKIGSEQEIAAYKKLQGRLSPLLYAAEPGQALVTERVKGRPLKEILDRIARPIKDLQNQKDSLVRAMEQSQDPEEINRYKTEIKKVEEQIKKNKERFNKAAQILYKQVGQLGAALQQMGVVHNDLASGNVFFAQGGVQAIDLGNATVIPPGQTQLSPQQKFGDFATAVQRSVIDRDYFGILNPLQAASSIVSGYAQPLPIPEARQIDESLLTPSQKAQPVKLRTTNPSLAYTTIPNLGQFPFPTRPVNPVVDIPDVPIEKEQSVSTRVNQPNLDAVGASEATSRKIYEELVKIRAELNSIGKPPPETDGGVLVKVGGGGPGGGDSPAGANPLLKLPDQRAVRQGAQLAIWNTFDAIAKYYKGLEKAEQAVLSKIPGAQAIAAIGKAILPGSLIAGGMAEVGVLDDFLLGVQAVFEHILRTGGDAAIDVLMQNLSTDTADLLQGIYDIADSAITTDATGIGSRFTNALGETQLALLRQFLNLIKGFADGGQAVTQATLTALNTIGAEVAGQLLGDATAATSLLVGGKLAQNALGEAGSYASKNPIIAQVPDPWNDQLAPAGGISGKPPVGRILESIREDKEYRKLVAQNKKALSPEDYIQLLFQNRANRQGLASLTVQAQADPSILPETLPKADGTASENPMAVLLGESGGLERELRSLLGIVLDESSAVRGAMEEVGYNLPESLLKGIKNFSNLDKEAKDALALDLIKEVKSAFGIASPSKVFIQIGKDVILGFTVSLEKGIEEIKKLEIPIPELKKQGWQDIEDYASELEKITALKRLANQDGSSSVVGWIKEDLKLSSDVWEAAGGGDITRGYRDPNVSNEIASSLIDFMANIGRSGRPTTPPPPPEKPVIRDTPPDSVANPDPVNNTDIRQIAQTFIRELRSQLAAGLGNLDYSEVFDALNSLDDAAFGTAGMTAMEYIGGFLADMDQDAGGAARALEMVVLALESLSSAGSNALLANGVVTPSPAGVNGTNRNQSSAAGSPVTCPACLSTNLPGIDICEVCGYDITGHHTDQVRSQTGRRNPTNPVVGNGTAPNSSNSRVFYVTPGGVAFDPSDSREVPAGFVSTGSDGNRVFNMGGGPSPSSSPVGGGPGYPGSPGDPSGGAPPGGFPSDGMMSPPEPPDNRRVVEKWFDMLVNHINRSGQNIDEGLWAEVNRQLDLMEALAAEAGEGVLGLGRVYDAIAERAPGIARLGTTLKDLGIGALALMGLDQFDQVLLNIAQQGIQASLQMERFQIALSYVGGGQTKAQLESVRDLAAEIGTNFVTSAENYSKLTIAAANTNLESQVPEIFSGFTRALTAQGASAEEQQRAFLAVEQMIGKGQIMAEELRQQLSEVMPQAAGALARSRGITTQQLFREMQTTPLSPETDLLPLAKQLEIEATIPLANFQDSNIKKMAYFESKQQEISAGIGGAILNVPFALDTVNAGMGIFAELAGTATRSAMVLAGVVGLNLVGGLFQTAAGTRIVTIALKAMGLEFLTNNFLLKAWNAKVPIAIAQNGKLATSLGLVSGGLSLIGKFVLPMAALGIAVDGITKMWGAYNTELKKVADQSRLTVRELKELSKQREIALGNGQSQITPESNLSNDPRFNPDLSWLFNRTGLALTRFNLDRGLSNYFGVLDVANERGERQTVYERRGEINSRQEARNISSSVGDLINTAERNVSNQPLMDEGNRKMIEVQGRILDVQAQLERVRYQNDPALYKKLLDEMSGLQRRRGEIIEFYFPDSAFLESGRKMAEEALKFLESQPDFAGRNDLMDVLRTQMDQIDVYLAQYGENVRGINRYSLLLAARLDTLGRAMQNAEARINLFASTAQRDLAKAIADGNYTPSEAEEVGARVELGVAMARLEAVMTTRANSQAIIDAVPEQEKAALMQLPEFSNIDLAQYGNSVSEMLKNISPEIIQEAISNNNSINAELRELLRAALINREALSQQSDLEQAVYQARANSIRIQQQQLLAVRQSQVQIAAANSTSRTAAMFVRGDIGDVGRSVQDAMDNRSAAQDRLALAEDKLKRPDIFEPTETLVEVAEAQAALGQAEVEVINAIRSARDAGLQQARSVEDYNQSVADYQLQTAREYRNFQFEVQDAGIRMIRETRDLSESWQDLMFDLETRVADANNAVADARNELEATQRRIQVESVSPFDENIGRRAANILANYFDALNNNESEARGLSQEQRKLSQEYLVTLRSIRAEIEKQFDAERERSRMILQLNDRYADLVMTAQKGIRDLQRTFQDLGISIERQFPGQESFFGLSSPVPYVAGAPNAFGMQNYYGASGMGMLVPPPPPGQGSGGIPMGIMPGGIVNAQYQQQLMMGGSYFGSGFGYGQQAPAGGMGYGYFGMPPVTQLDPLQAAQYNNAAGRNLSDPVYTYGYSSPPVDNRPREEKFPLRNGSGISGYFSMSEGRQMGLYFDPERREFNDTPTAARGRSLPTPAAGVIRSGPAPVQPTQIIAPAPIYDRPQSFVPTPSPAPVVARPVQTQSRGIALPSGYGSIQGLVNQHLVNHPLFNITSRSGLGSMALAIATGATEHFGYGQRETNWFTKLGGRDSKGRPNRMRGFAQANLNYHDAATSNPQSYLNWIGNIFQGNAVTPNSKGKSNFGAQLVNAVQSGAVNSGADLIKQIQRMGLAGSNWQALGDGWRRNPGLADWIVNFIKQQLPNLQSSIGGGQGSNVAMGGPSLNFGVPESIQIAQTAQASRWFNENGQITGNTIQEGFKGVANDLSNIFYDLLRGPFQAPVRPVNQNAVDRVQQNMREAGEKVKTTPAPAPKPQVPNPANIIMPPAQATTVPAQTTTTSGTASWQQVPLPQPPADFLRYQDPARHTNLKDLVSPHNRLDMNRVYPLSSPNVIQNQLVQPQAPIVAPAGSFGDIAPVQRQDPTRANQLAGEEYRLRAQAIALRIDNNSAKAELEYLRYLNEMANLFNALEGRTISLNREIFNGSLRYREIARDAKGYVTAAEEVAIAGENVQKQFNDIRFAAEDRDRELMRELTNSYSAIATMQEQLAEQSARGTLLPGQEQEIRGNIEQIKQYIGELENQRVALKQNTESTLQFEEKTRRARVELERLNKIMEAQRGFGDRLASFYTTRYEVGAQNSWGLGTLIDPTPVINAQLQAATQNKELDEYIRRFGGLLDPRFVDQLRQMQEETNKLNIDRAFVKAIPGLEAFSSELRAVILESQTMAEAFTKLGNVVLGMLLDQLTIKPIQNAIAGWLAPLLGLTGEQYQPVETSLGGGFAEGLNRFAVPFALAGANSFATATGLQLPAFGSQSVEEGLARTTDSTSGAISVLGQVATSAGQGLFGVGESSLSQIVALGSFITALNAATAALYSFSGGLGGQTAASGASAILPAFSAKDGAGAFTSVGTGALGFGANLLMGLFAEGGSVKDKAGNLPIPVMSGGGYIEAAMQKERTQSGREPVLAVLNVDEYVIPANEGQDYLNYREWKKLKAGDVQVKNFASGGFVKGGNISSTTTNTSEGNRYVFNNTTNIKVQNPNDIGRTAQQIARQQQLAAERRMS